jgi:hypothetical protein
MASSTVIANLALSHLGIGVEISNLDTERSQEALACRRFYDIARQSTLRDFPWPFATKFVSPTLIEEDPTDEWGFSYRYPADCLKIRRILSGLRNDNRQSRAPYKVAQDDNGKLFYCDIEDAEIEYTVDEDNEDIFDSDFTMALSLRLAAYIAPRLTAGDPFKLGERAMQLYLFELNTARANSLNEEQVEQDPESEYIRVRDGI